MKKISSFFKIIFGVLLLTFITSNSLAANNSMSDPNKLIEITKDNPVFSIKLTANPASGSGWFLKDCDNTLLQPVKKIYYTTSATNKKNGGYEVWTFKATAAAFLVPRIMNITLLYANPHAMQNLQGSTFRIITK